MIPEWFIANFIQHFNKHLGFAVAHRSRLPAFFSEGRTQLLKSVTNLTSSLALARCNTKRAMHTALRCVRIEGGLHSQCSLSKPAKCQAASANSDQHGLAVCSQKKFGTTCSSAQGQKQERSESRVLQTRRLSTCLRASQVISKGCGVATLLSNGSIDTHPQNTLH